MDHLDVWNLFWIVIVNDFIIKFVTVIMKALVALLPGQILPYKKKVRRKMIHICYHIAISTCIDLYLYHLHSSTHQNQIIIITTAAAATSLISSSSSLSIVRRPSCVIRHPSSIILFAYQLRTDMFLVRTSKVWEMLVLRMNKIFLQSISLMRIIFSSGDCVCRESITCYWRTSRSFIAVLYQSRPGSTSYRMTNMEDRGSQQSLSFSIQCVRSVQRHYTPRGS